MSDQKPTAPLKNLLSLAYALAICAIAGSAFYFLSLQPAQTQLQPAQGKKTLQAGTVTEQTMQAGPQAQQANGTPASPPAAATAEKKTQAEAFPPAEKKSKEVVQDTSTTAQVDEKKQEKGTEKELPAGDPQAGEQLYAQHCTACHGADAKGQIGPSLADDQYRYGKSPAALTESVTNGRPGGMPAFGDRLSQSQIENLVAYLLSL